MMIFCGSQVGFRDAALFESAGGGVMLLKTKRIGIKNEVSHRKSYSLYLPIISTNT